MNSTVDKIHTCSFVTKASTLTVNEIVVVHSKVKIRLSKPNYY